jgi:hypothetical protein
LLWEKQAEGRYQEVLNSTIRSWELEYYPKSSEKMLKTGNIEKKKKNLKRYKICCQEHSVCPGEMSWETRWTQAEHGCI